MESKPILSYLNNNIRLKEKIENLEDNQTRQKSTEQENTKIIYKKKKEIMCFTQIPKQIEVQTKKQTVTFTNKVYLKKKISGDYPFKVNLSESILNTESQKYNEFETERLNNDITLSLNALNEELNKDLFNIKSDKQSKFTLSEIKSLKEITDDLVKYYKNYDKDIKRIGKGIGIKY